MKILIIGAVAAGLKSASKARREDGKAEITVLERGKLISYGACGMPYYVGGEVHDIKELMATGAGNPRNADRAGGTASARSAARARRRSKRQSYGGH